MQFNPFENKRNQYIKIRGSESSEESLVSPINKVLGNIKDLIDLGNKRNTELTQSKKNIIKKNIFSESKDIFTKQKKNFSNFIEVLNLRNSLRTKSKGVRKDRKTKEESKSISGLTGFLADGIFKALIDIATFKVLQWLADKRNQNKIRKTFETIKKIFVFSGKIFKFLGNLFFEKIPNFFKNDIPKFFLNIKKGISKALSGLFKSVSTAAIGIAKFLKSITIDPILKGLGELFNSIRGLSKKFNTDELNTLDDIYNPLDSFSDVFNKNVDELLGFKDVRGDLDSVQSFLGDSIDERDLDESINSTNEIDTLFKNNNAGIGSVPNFGTSNGSVSSMNSPQQSAKMSAINDVVKNKTKATIRPLDSTFTTQNFAKKAYNSEDLEGLYNLPIKAVGMALIGLTLNATKGIPGLNIMLKPILNSIGGTFGLDSSILSKYLTGGVSLGGGSFSNIFKKFIKFIKIFANERKSLGSFSSPLSGIKNAAMGATSGLSNVAGNTQFSGNNNREIIYNFFKEKTNSDVIAAGFVGNFAVESSFNPTAVGDGGDAFGIAQWNSRRQELIDFAESNNMDYRDLKTQLEFAWHELNNKESATLRALQGVKDPSIAAEIIMKKYERPSVPHLDRRQQESVAAMKDFAGMMRGGLVKSEKKVGDTVPTKLEDGEFVLNKNAVKLVGEDTLIHLNDVLAHRFSSNKTSKSIRDIALNIDPSKLDRYKPKKKKTKAPNIRAITLPETVNNSINNSAKARSEAPLGRTKDMSLISFSGMMGEYV